MKLSSNLVIALFIVAGVALNAQTAISVSGATTQTTARVKGTVRGGGLTVVTFEGEGQAGHTVRKVTTDDNGRYEVDLSAGIYRIKVEMPGYFPFRRAALSIPAGSDLIINITPTPRVLEVATFINQHSARLGEREITAPPPKYEVFRPIPAAHPLDLLIQFNEKRRSRKNTEYVDAVVSYDTLTIYADKVHLNREDLRLIAEGNVVVEDGKQMSYVRCAEISFESQRPVLTLTRGAISSAKGAGALQDEAVTFKFDVSREGGGRIFYEDKKSGVSFVSNKIDGFRVINDTLNKVEIKGRGSLSGRVPAELAYRGSIPVSFTAIVQDDDVSSNGKDAFSIDFHLNNFRVTGHLSQGNIEVQRLY